MELYFMTLCCPVSQYKESFGWLPVTRATPRLTGVAGVTLYLNLSLIRSKVIGQHLKLLKPTLA